MPKYRIGAANRMHPSALQLLQGAASSKQAWPTMTMFSPNRDMPCAGERGMPKYQVLRRLGLGAKKVGKNTIEGIMKRYRVSEEDGQEGRMHIKARARVARARSPGPLNRVRYYITGRLGKAYAQVARRMPGQRTACCSGKSAKTNMALRNRCRV